MTIIINGSGSITGATTLASTVTSPTLTTPVITSTLGVGNATPSGSGAGITFPATQSASTDANTLDDYEEGTWTPVLTPSVGSITTQVSTGKYTKVGNVVNVSFNAFISNVGTASGLMSLVGLPFTAASTNGIASCFGVRENNSTGVMYQGFVNQGQSYVSIFTLTNSAPPWTNSYAYTSGFSYIAA